MDGLTVASLADAHLLAHTSAPAEVVERFGVPGSNDPARVFLSRVMGGFEHEILASRGLDIGYASWRGVPLAWRSPVQDARPLDQPTGSSWLSRFIGGLLTSCGPFHIGAATAEHGLHGDFSHRPAARIVADARNARTVVTGAVEVHDLFGGSVTIQRTIESYAGADFARISVHDRVENTGPVSVPVQMLYHVNIGPPVAVPGTRVQVDADNWQPRSLVTAVPAPSPLPPVCDAVVEAVFAHTGIRTGADGWAHAVVARPGSGLEVDVAWEPQGLPYMHQWVYPTRGRWALALEPATVPLTPLAATTDSGDAAVGPNQSRDHRIMITVREVA
ncbi:DUF4432 family protein [Microbacterium sp. MC2]